MPQPAALRRSLSEKHFQHCRARGDDKKFKTVSERETKKYRECHQNGEEGGIRR